MTKQDVPETLKTAYIECFTELSDKTRHACLASACMLLWYLLFQEYLFYHSSNSSKITSETVKYDVFKNGLGALGPDSPTANLIDLCSMKPGSFDDEKTDAYSCLCGVLENRQLTLVLRPL